MQRAVVALVCAVLSAALPAPALAQVRNGQLAVGLRDRIVAVNPDGSGQRTLYAPSSGEITSPVWSPDGNALAFVWDDKIALLDVAARRAELLTQPGDGERDADPAWSVSGDAIGFRRIGRLTQSRHRVAVATRLSAQLGSMDLATSGFAYTPGLNRWAYALGPLLYLSSGTGFELRSSVSSRFSWSPDGSALAYVDDGTAAYRAGVTVIEDAWRAPKHTPVVPGSGAAPRWSPDGRSLVFVQDGAVAIAAAREDATVSAVPGVAGATAVDWQPCGDNTTIGCESVVPPTCTTTTVQVTTQADQPVALPAPPCTDNAGRSLRLVVVSRGDHGTLADDGVYTPRSGFTGQDAVSYRVSNGAAQSELVRVAIFVVPRPAAAAPPGTNPPAIAAAPYLSLRVRPALDRKRSTLARLSCDRTCTFTVRLDARLRAKSKRVKGKAVRRTLAPGRVLALRLKLPAKPKGRLKSAFITGTVRGANGATRSVKLPVTVRR